MSEADIQTAQGSDIAGAGETKTFQADVARLLELMVHSIYSERDVFLRELISNAADACEKLRYESIAEPNLTADGEGFAIRVVVDKEAKTLAVVDNGIGMARDDLDRALGTIASSGTKAFLDRIGSQAEEESGNLIGQFGIGFYSAFMVADSVEVRTRRAGTDQAWRWTSDGKGSYAVAALPLDEAPTRGTRVTLHLNEEAAKDFLEPWRIERLIKEHSGAVAVPIDLQETPDGESRRLTDGAALWAKAKSDITPEQYTEFYRALAAQYDEPALTIHYRAEGRHEYSVLAFVPGSKPFDLFDPQRKGRTKLYVRRVLITDEADLLPGWLRFVRAVVDTADLPLNVSREMVQNSPVFAAIRKGVTNRVLGDLTKMADNDADGFAKLWENFGAVLKEGIYEDPERRDGLFKLARFATTKHPDGGRTLAQYVADLRENQTAIYYLVGDDLARLKTSPQLEGFRARGIEVLLLPDAVDAFWVQNAVGFEGKPFKSVTQGAADIKSVPMAEGEKGPEDRQVGPKVATLLAFMKQTLEGSVEDVRASDRLSESPACLIAPEFGPDRRLEKILAQHGKLGGMASKPVLEVNPGHPLVTALADRFAGEGDRAVVEDSAWLLHDEARIMDGELPADAAAFAARLRRVMEKAAG